ncbi:SLC13 family permease [Roseibium sp. RKSG952]|uniref:SLC13 family permease n=1 Tax=Roseibium sp. RKSG952 TaxID=2529384 RepID=UPI0012BB73D7|nr:SLC13 family permease [Roseibium sp. RKSG952]MTH98858.1 arsenic resistance protein [Roseibium sp. RKSG952]
MTFSLGISIVIFLLISVRQWLPEWVRIWQIMTAGAVILLVTGQIGPVPAFKAVDWDVIAYLFGVFTISHALYDCGIAHRLSDWIHREESGTTGALFLFMLLVALISAVLTNDAAAAIGTPIAITIAARAGIAPNVPLIALCAAVTVGSMMSPVGNPQNILIVTDGHFTNPVGTFLAWLLVPSLLSILFAFMWYRFCFSKAEKVDADTHTDLPEPSSERLWPALTATGILVVLVLTKSLFQEQIPALGVSLGIISLISCLPVYLFSRERLTILRQVDWHTLIFFVAMFVVTGAILESGALQNLLGSWQTRLNEPFIVAKVSFWASQLFSNVPVVEIYLNLLHTKDTATLMLLAGISTLAGNLFIISAASNVIVVQQAEKLGTKPFQFWEFSRLVIPVTIFSLAVCYGWVVYIYPML